MEGVNFWKENIHPTQGTTNIQNLLPRKHFRLRQQRSSDNNCCYIAKRLVAQSKCMICKEMLISTGNSIANDKYLNLLSRGRLTVPSANLADFGGCCFAVLDFVGDHMQKHQIIHVREVSNDILHRYAPVLISHVVIMLYGDPSLPSNLL